MGGLSLYALLAAGIMALVSYGLYERGNAAKADAKAALHLVDEYRQDLAESEADKDQLKARNKKTDALVVEKDKRNAKLEAEKRATKDELDRLKTSLPKEDQECLDRPLPAAIVERLRNTGTDKDKERPATDTSGPSVAVPEVRTPR